MKFFGAGLVARLTLANRHFLGLARLKLESYLMLASAVMRLAVAPWQRLFALVAPVVTIAFNTTLHRVRGATNYPSCWRSLAPIGGFEFDVGFQPSGSAVWRQGPAGSVHYSEVGS